MNNANEWSSYKVCKHEGMGYALFKWNKEGMIWQQVTRWYAKKGNLRRHVLKNYGFHIM